MGCDSGYGNGYKVREGVEYLRGVDKKFRRQRHRRRGGGRKKSRLSKNVLLPPLPTHVLSDHYLKQLSFVPFHFPFNMDRSILSDTHPSPRPEWVNLEWKFARWWGIRQPTGTLPREIRQPPRFCLILLFSDNFALNVLKTLMHRSVLCPIPPPGRGIWSKKLVPPPGLWSKYLFHSLRWDNFYAIKLLGYAILIWFYVFRHNVSRIAKNSTLKRDAGENFAVLCIETSSEKFAILLKICALARGWGIWEKSWPEDGIFGQIPTPARGVCGEKN